MKTLSSDTVPKLARNLTGRGNSPPLVDKSTPILPRAAFLRRWRWAFVRSLGLLNPFRWLNKRITQRPQVNWPAGVRFLILSVCSFPLQAGIISTIAGSGSQAYGGDGGPATSASLYSPADVAVDSSGNLYIADAGNSRIRKVTGTTINTIAGSATAGFSGDGGAATSAQLSQPLAVAFDSSGNLYIADSNNDRIRKVTVGATISTVAGDGTPGYSGDNGPATSAQISHPTDVAVDSSNNLYIADFLNQRIRKVTPGGIISTVAGTGTAGYNGDGIAAASAQLYRPYSVAVDSSGNLYIADESNNRIRKVTVGGIISTVAGNGSSGYSGDGGAAISAQLSNYTHVAVDNSGNLYIADESNNRIRKVTLGGTIYTVVGTGTPGYSGDGGASTSAQLLNPNGIAFDSSGSLYIADFFNQRIRKVLPAPIIDVQGNSTSIVSGDTTPTTTDNTDFGSTPVGTPVNKTFTINNIGELPLNLTGSPIVSVTGNGFSMTTSPTSPVATSTGTNFVIQFTPTTAGISNGMVSIANNDIFHNPYTFSITGAETNTAPTANNGSLTTTEDTVGSGTLIASDVDANPLTYGIVANSTKGTAFITNTSTGAYTYTPTANLNGTDSFTFQVNDGTVNSNIATVTVTITPVNDAPSFTASNPPVVIENSGTHTVTNWATFNPGPNETDNVLAYTISNITNPSLFSSAPTSAPTVDGNGTLTYTLATNHAGTTNFDVTVRDDGGTANGGVDLSITTTFAINVTAPEINLIQGSTTQASGSSYDFGGILIGQSSPAITFTIDNSGNANLLLTSSPKVAVTGTAASEFRVTGNTTSPILPGGYTTFMVTFTPTIIGFRTAQFTIANNDGDESNYTVTLQGVGLTPKFSVKQGSLDLPNGGSFNVGPSAIGRQVTYPFTIDNLGNSKLTLSGTPKIRVSGNNTGEFSVDETLTTSPLAGGGNTTFLLTFIPNSLGTKTATVTLATNDPTNSNYSFTVTGSAEPHKNLQITVTGTGQGSVTSDPTGIDCETALRVCSMPVIDAPEWVTLTPVPATGSEFIGWTGDAACQADGKVLVTVDTACTATFGLKNYQLTANFLGRGRVTGPGIDCPGQCTATYLYGTTVTLKAQATRKMWEFSSWRGCDSQGTLQITNDVLCQAVFTPDPNIPNAGDGNGDGQPDAYQDNVVSLPDKVTGTYLTLETQPATCVISDIYPDLAESQTIKLDHTKKFPQGMLYFDIACPQAQVSVYYHAMTKLYRNLKFYKFGPKIPGDLTTLAWYQLPNIKYEVVTIGGKPVVKGTYTLTDGELGDSTSVDGHIVDPGGVVYP